MKKIVLMMAAMCLWSTVAFSQTDSSVDTTYAESCANPEEQEALLLNKFVKNWDVSLGGGTQFFHAEYIPGGHFKVKDWWSPAIDFSIMKWGSPCFGLGLGFNTGGYKGLYSINGDVRASFRRDGVDPIYWGDKNFYFAKGWYGNAFAELWIELTNLFFKYNPKRVFVWTARLGGGIVFPMSKVIYGALGASFNADMGFHFRVAKHLLIGVDLRGALISDCFNGIGFTSSGDRLNIPIDGAGGITLGLKYQFGFVSHKDKKSGRVETDAWVPLSTAIASSALVEELEAKNAAGQRALSQANSTIAQNAQTINSLKNENSALRNAIAANGNYIPVPEWWSHINFKVDRWEIPNHEKVNIMAAADFIKSCPADTKFYVRGYADKQTASVKRNIVLAKNRARVVSECLVNEFGVNPDQLVIEDYGGVDYMYYNDKQCSRSVIITVAK